MNMAITRRDVLKTLTTGTAAVATAGTMLSGVTHAEEQPTVPPAAVGMLYDATKCIGCQSCVAACAEANQLQPDTRLDPLHQAPRDLNYTTKNIIKLYKPADGKSYSYVKQQCVHCVDPACVAGCMFKGLKKDPKTGVVTWNSKLCVGCRYCEISCPYHIPKFQWEGFNPKIVKCEFCKERLAAGQQPACTSVCPAKAVIFGSRAELLAEAKNRIKQNPGKYYQDRVFGEREGGGTQVLYLSHVPFENLGLPKLPDESVPSKYLKWQKRVYSYLAVPVVLYASVVGVIRNNWKDHQEHVREEEKKTGLRAQL
jgi:Fe-S-cluster-containing dehydrogenase component